MIISTHVEKTVPKKYFHNKNSQYTENKRNIPQHNKGLK